MAELSLPPKKILVSAQFLEAGNTSPSASVPAVPLHFCT